MIDPRLLDLPDGSMTVRHRTGQRCPARKAGRLVAYDVQILPQWRSPHQPRGFDRGYVLLDESIQITQPVTFAGGPLEGWWYVDVVAVEDRDDELVVRDLYVDFLVPPDRSRFDLLDLDDLADAIEAEDVSPAEAAATLRAAQRFADRHLTSPDRSGQPLAPFPPADVLELLGQPPFA